MRRQKQLSFDGKGFEKPKSYFGGSYLKTHNPKSKRPLSSKFALRRFAGKAAWHEVLKYLAA